MIMHDAATPITERIEYATEVQVALDFSETRRALREKPRQSYSYNLLEMTRSVGVNWWRARETTDLLVPWLPSAVCRGAAVPTDLLPEYEIGSTVYVITRDAVGAATITGYAAGVPLFTSALTGGFIAPAVQGRASVSPASYTGTVVRSVTVEVRRATPTPVGTPFTWNSFPPDRATNITESIAYRMGEIGFTGAVLPFRDYYSNRPRIAHSYGYTLIGLPKIAAFRAFFMTQKGRLLQMVGDPRSYVPLAYKKEAGKTFVYALRQNNQVWMAGGIFNDFEYFDYVSPGVWEVGSFDSDFVDVCMEEAWSDRRIDQDTLEITHITPGVATSSLVITDL